MPAAARPDRSALPAVALLVGLALVVGGGLVWLVKRDRAAASTVVAEADAALAAEKAAASREAEVRAGLARERQEEADQAEQQAAVLEAENERLKQQLAAAQEDRDRAAASAAQGAQQAEAYRKGLGRAVEELNRQGSRSVTAPPAARPAGADVKAYYGPSVFMVGDSVQVSGKVGNFGSSARSFTLNVDLKLDGFSEGTQSVQMRLEPGETAPYHVDFGSRGQHNFTAKAVVE